MFKQCESQEHYKMYKKGKTWVFAAIVTTTLALGVAGGQTAKADTAPATDNQTADTGSQSATPAKAVTLTSATKNDTGTTTPPAGTGADVETSATENKPQSDATTTKPTTQPSTPATKTAETTPAETTATETSTTTTPTKVEAATTPAAPVTKKAVTRVTTAVTPDMQIKAPTQKKMRHTARMLAPAAPKVATAAVTTAVTATSPVTTADESIDQWMPNKTLQQAVLGTFQSPITTGNQAVVDSGKTWNSVADITQADMGLLTYFSIPSMGLSTYIDGKSSFSLEGLQYAVNLQTLNVSNNMNWAPYSFRGDVTDLTPLKDLQNLKWLELTANRVSDITPVTGLKNLKELYFAQNIVSDFSSLNLAQYTDCRFIQQFVEKKLVYIPKTGSYVMDNPVKAPQGVTFTTSTVLRLGVPLSAVASTGNPTPTVRIFWNGADAVTLAGNQLSFSGIKDQIMPGGTENPFDYLYPNLVQEDYSYFLVTLFDATVKGVADTQVMMVMPYLKADAAKDVTVNYVDEAGKALTDPDTLTGFVGEAYTATPKELPGYVLTTTPANATGTFSDTAQTVTFVYKEATATVTVHYQDDQGKTIKPDDTVTGQIGEAYTIDHPAIAGYTYKETVGNATGTYEETPAEVTFIYTKDAVTPPVTPTQTITVTVHHQTADGTQVAPDVIITGQAGDTYTTSPAANIPVGYELVTTPANATGTMGDSDIVVTYLYAKTETDGDGDQVAPEPDKPTTPTKPTKPATEPDQVTPAKPVTPATGGQADQVTVGRRTPGKNGAATTVDLAAKPGATATQPDTEAKTTLPQTDEHSTSPLWGLAVLGSLLGLVGIKARRKNH
ncbi:MucBP domain-containing protein [Levilactobacillus suantsaiihabitans]|uniref:Gram-positive cocci surface proteins LPxTG domain-containing protein n=1 Tax=Levilactobacillus suantsaiihabitans TaxID=2487722 RepID=A0A4Z0JDB9_9LACO|nr:MucBP domain-containing protein [Levilactobacillus suantsaiihabitans]TGD19834.1 hypothetical protein EGT51_03075 [Levilactobacillus suantsaiihabitans]